MEHKIKNSSRNSSVQEHDIFSNVDHLLFFYQIQTEAYSNLMNRIWTQIQHYTWFLSILLSVAPVSIFTDKISIHKEIELLICLPFLGVLVAIIAFLIIRKDLSYLSEYDSRLLYIEKKLGVLKYDDYLDNRLRRAKRENFNVLRDSLLQNKMKWFSLRNVRIRRLILYSFISYILVGIVEILYLLFFLNK